LLAIDEILELLKNGQWHELKEIADKTNLQGFRAELISNFLAEYDFLEFDKKEKKIRLTPQLQLFLRNIENIEK